MMDTHKLNDATIEAARILVVEDQVDIAQFIQKALQQAGWQVAVAHSIAQAQIELKNQPVQTILLDLGLPDGDGLDLIANIRTWNQAPIIVLSARDQESDKIKALDAGADDYLAKPFSINELLARVRTQLRRWAQIDRGEDAPVLQFGSVVLDRQQQRITRDGAVVHLTQIEYQLLCYLVAHAGQVLTHRQLLKHIWGQSYAENAHYLRIYMSHLRKKLEVNPTQPEYFLTETGVGYRFVLGHENSRSF